MKQRVKDISENTICIENNVDGYTWFFYYQRVNGRWVSYRKERKCLIH